MCNLKKLQYIYVIKTSYSCTAYICILNELEHLHINAIIIPIRRCLCNRISWGAASICCKIVVKWLHIAGLFYNSLDPRFLSTSPQRPSVPSPSTPSYYQGSFLKMHFNLKGPLEFSRGGANGWYPNVRKV